MSSYAVLYNNLIKLGVKPQMANKVAKEIIDKSKNNPSLTDDEISALLDELSQSIQKLSNDPKTRETYSSKYVHAVLQGLIAAGIFELFMLSKSWLSSIFMSSPSEEMNRFMEASAKLSHYQQQDFSRETSLEVMSCAMAIENSKREIIKGVALNLDVECSDELVREVDNAILKLMSVVDFKHVQHLGLLEPQT